MDGLQCWEIGARYSEELRDYFDWRANEPWVKRSVNGVETHLNYYLKYFGFYNYHVLGMWQASQNKDVIEAPTLWEMPEIRSIIPRISSTNRSRASSSLKLYGMSSRYTGTSMLSS